MSGMRRSSGLMVEHTRSPAPHRLAPVYGHRRRREADVGAQCREVRIVRDLSEIRELLERKLAWYGLQSVRIGTFRRTGERTLLCDLLTADGSVLCRVNVDRRSCAVRIARGRGFEDRIAGVSAVVSANASDLAEAPSRQWHPIAGPHPTD